MGIVCGAGSRAVERSFRVNSSEQLRFCKYLWALLFSRSVVAFGKKKGKKYAFKKFTQKWTVRLKRSKGR